MPKSKTMNSYSHDYGLDKLLRVLEAQQQMLAILGHDPTWDDRAKHSDLGHEIIHSVHWTTKVMAELAGVRWAQSDEDLIMQKGRAGLEEVASRYNCRCFLGPAREAASSASLSATGLQVQAGAAG